MDIVEEIKKFVESECKKPSSKYGYEPFKFHFVQMAEHSEELASELGGDREVILIAAWLHDIGSIIHGRKDHHITGAKIAEEKLKELNYPAEKIELVKKCILNHRGSQKNNRESVEEQIIADADAMCNFDMIPGLFKAAFVYEDKTQGNRTQGEAKISIRQKLERKWKQLHFDKSKKIIKPKFEAVMLLLK